MSKKRLTLSLLGVLCSATLVGSMFLFKGTENVNAAETDTTVEMVTNVKEGYAGDEISLDVKVSENPGLAGLTVWVSYDTTVLSFVSATAVEDFFKAPMIKKDTDGNGFVNYVFAAADATPGTGTILNIKFKIKDDAKIGKTEFGYKTLNGTISLSDSEVKKATILGETATVDVKCKHTSTSEDITKEATCTEKGSKNTVCNKCNATVSTSEIAALGHAFGEYVVTKESTCEEKGEETATCTRTGCTATDKKEIAALGHAFGEYVVTKEPTCEEKGEETATCTRTGCTVTDKKEIAALGHKFDNFEIVKVETDKEDGEIKGYCTACNKETISVIPKLSNDKFALTDVEGNSLKAEYTVGDVLKLKVTSYNAYGNGDKSLGNVRYVPISYTIDSKETKFENNEYSFETKVEKAGDTKITVVYAREVYTTEGWIAGKETYTSETDVKVVEKKVPSNNNNSNNNNTTDNNSSNNIEETKKPESNTPQTGDNVGVVVGLFVILMIAAGTSVVMVRRKKNA